MNQWTHDHIWEIISESSHSIEKRCSECGFVLAIGCGGCPKHANAAVALAIVDESGESAARLTVIA